MALLSPLKCLLTFLGISISTPWRPYMSTASARIMRSLMSSGSFGSKSS